MLNENQLNEIKEKLEYGEEIHIFCESIEKAFNVCEQLKHTQGNLRVIAMGEVA
jgi:hypothetical protein